MKEAPRYRRLVKRYGKHSGRMYYAYADVNGGVECRLIRFKLRKRKIRMRQTLRDKYNAQRSKRHPWYALMLAIRVNNITGENGGVPF